MLADSFRFQKPTNAKPETVSSNRTTERKRHELNRILTTELYKQELAKAVHNTATENYLVPSELNLFGKHEPYRNNETYQALCEFFFNLYGEPDNTIDLTKVTGQCINLHIEISKVIKQKLEINSILTIGYVNIAGQDFYKFEKFDSNLFRVQADKKEVVDIHAWLTLPSYEIIDLTFLAHISYVSSTPEKKEQLKKATSFPYYFGSPDFLYSDELVIYHPKYVGEDILRKNRFKNTTT